MTEITRLIRSASTASLGTLAEDGMPFVSLVTVASAASASESPRSLVMLLSGLAVHTQNLRRNSVASLLIQTPASPDTDPLTAPRVTLTGSVEQLTRDQDADDRERFLDKHPSASMYADFGDFAIYRFTVDVAHLVAGFGKIVTVAGDDLQ